MGQDNFDIFLKLVKKGDAVGLRRLIAVGWNVNGEDPTGWQTPLCWVNGNTAFIQILLDAGANVNPIVPGDNTPLVMAAQHGMTNAVRILLQAGARVDVNPAGCSLFAWIKTGAESHPEITRMLTEAGASTELRGNLHLYGMKSD